MLWALPFVFFYVLWREGRIGPIEIATIVIAVGWSATLAFLSICRILIDENSIVVKFLLPFSRGGTFTHNEIESYSPMAFQRKNRAIPVGGMLKPKGCKPMMIWPTGVDNFAEVNMILTKLFPKEEQTTEPEPGEVRETSSRPSG
jgi:hypothetical protein